MTIDAFSDKREKPRTLFLTIDQDDEKTFKASIRDKSNQLIVTIGLHDEEILACNPKEPDEVFRFDGTDIRSRETWEIFCRQCGLIAPNDLLVRDHTQETNTVDVTQEDLCVSPAAKRQLEIIDALQKVNNGQVWRNGQPFDPDIDISVDNDPEDTGDSSLDICDLARQAVINTILDVDRSLIISGDPIGITWDNVSRQVKYVRQWKRVVEREAIQILNNEFNGNLNQDYFNRQRDLIDELFEKTVDALCGDAYTEKASAQGIRILLGNWYEATDEGYTLAQMVDDIEEVANRIGAFSRRMKKVTEDIERKQAVQRRQRTMMMR